MEIVSRIQSFSFNSKFQVRKTLAVGPTDLPIQFVPEFPSLGVKRPEIEAGHSSPSSAKVEESVDLYVNSPNTPSWFGAQFKKKA
jgi:hypothetical protein